MNWTQEEKDALFHEIASDIAYTLARKNHDYGDSFHDQYVKYGNLGTVIRLFDKVQRIESLLKFEAQVDESIEDTLKDIAGYAILTLSSIHRLNSENPR